MKHAQHQITGAIDAVITWVNGNSDDHRNTRRTHMANARFPLHENAVNPHRWDCNDEIIFCLQSIHNYAPWIRKIWIVIDGEKPNLARVSDTLKTKVEYAYHRDLFDGYRDALPTFNSLAIESLLWRIEGLSERFMYFNDDVFLTSPLKPADVFVGATPVLRGKWVDYAKLVGNTKKRSDPAKFNHYMQINAAGLVGFDAGRLFRAAHVVHPLRRSKMAHLFEHHKTAFERNIHARFRDLGQFLPQGLHNHACITEQEAVLRTKKDHVHIKSGRAKSTDMSQTRMLLQSCTRSDIKFLCVNDLPQLEMVVPDTREWLSDIVGGFPKLRMSETG